ncbi:MAG: hypothetical protein NTV06_04080 [candidate division Zixibacteria bacterium]|nr:hypothetical protein [candidate division Zixibacteria bacterium]
MSASAAVLQELTAAVTDCRDAFRGGLKGLDPVVRDPVERGFQARIDRALGKPMLGEVAPHLLTGMFNAREDSFLGFVGPWMDIYTATVLADDGIDGQNPATNAEVLVTSMLLLQRGQSGIYRAMPVSGNASLLFDGFFAEAAQAVLVEFQRRARVTSYTEKDIDHLGRKVALLKLCATCILIADGQEVSGELLVPIEWLATGMQLLDDITDWEEDLSAGNFTPLLSQTIRFVEARPVAWDHQDHLQGIAAIVLSGSLEQCIERAIAQLQKVAALPNLKHGSIAERLLDAIIRENPYWGSITQAGLFF